MQKIFDASAIDDGHGEERSEQVQGKICHAVFGGGCSGDDHPTEADQLPSTVRFDRNRQTIAGGYSPDVLKQNSSLQNLTGTK